MEPDNPAVLHLLGVVFHQTGDNKSAFDLITKALQIDPGYAEAHSNLGLVLEQLDRPGDAADSYRKAIKINPQYAEGTSGENAEALATYYQQTFLNKFTLSRSFGNLRDHALLFYVNMPLEEHQKLRKRVPEPVPPRHLS